MSSCIDGTSFCQYLLLLFLFCIYQLRHYCPLMDPMSIVYQICVPTLKTRLWWSWWLEIGRVGTESMQGVRLIISHKEFGFKCKYSMQKIVLKIKKERNYMVSSQSSSKIKFSSKEEKSVSGSRPQNTVFYESWVSEYHCRVSVLGKLNNGSSLLATFIQ